jgi:hypothetical protein
MNVLLLCLVLPFFVFLLLHYAWLAYRLHCMSDEHRTIAWGGLHGSVFYVLVLTYLISSFGCTSSFVLFASLDPPESFSILLFMLINASCTAFTYALLGQRKNLLLVTLWTNVVVITILFVYTVVTFNGASQTSTTGLLVVTHLCNVVSIVHVYVMDLMIWYSGWRDALDAYKTLPSMKYNMDGAAFGT